MKQREGFTLIEVVVALMLMSISVLGMQMVTTTMLRQMTTGYKQLTAVQLAEDRMDRIRLEPVYANLPSYVAVEPAITGFATFVRTTTVTQTRTVVGIFVTDYRRVTVTVTAPGLPAPVKRTLVIGAP